MITLRNNYNGIYSLMLTPFYEDRSIDYKTYEEYTVWQAQQGVEHLFAVCGSSEMGSLNLEERLRLARLTVKNKGTTTVVATANMEYGFDSQIEEVKRMADTGVDGLVFTTRGMGDRPDELVDYIGRLSAYTDLPVYMYEFPGLQPHLISGETYGRLVRECGIVGIKDTTCTEKGIASKIAEKGESCVIDAFVSGDFELAKKRYQEIILLDDSIDSGFNNSAKYLVQLQGIKGFLPINRSNNRLSPARLQSLRSFHDWCVSEGLMK